MPQESLKKEHSVRAHLIKPRCSPYSQDRLIGPLITWVTLAFLNRNSGSTRYVRKVFSEEDES